MHQLACIHAPRIAADRAEGRARGGSRTSRRRHTLLIIALIAGVTVPHAAAQSSTLDLDGDTDRTGAIEGTREEEVLEESTSVILLNNCDDDDEDGRADNRDVRANGERDETDLEAIILRRARVPLTERVYLELLNPPEEEGGAQLEASKKLRIFNETGTAVLGPETSSRYYLTEGELRALAERDLEYRAEGVEFGTQTRLVAGHGATADDALLLEVAPFILTPHTLDVSETLVVEVPTGPAKATSDLYVRALRAACETAGTPLIVERGRDSWVQDEMQWGYTQTPRVTLPVVLHMYRLRGAAEVVEGLLGPDTGYFRAFDYIPGRNTGLDYGGNLEVTPATEAYPYGRVYYGSVVSPPDVAYQYRRRAIDAGYRRFFEGQGIQPPIDFTTDWLAVGHIDQLFTFVPGPDGQFTVLIASPKLGLDLLQGLDPATPLHGYYDEGFNAASVGELLQIREAGRSVVDFNLDIDAKLFGPDRSRPDAKSIQGTLMRELDIGPDRFLELPMLFHNGDAEDRVRMYAQPLTPALVNLSSLGTTTIMGDPMIPEFRRATESALESIGQQAIWIDAWWRYHMLHGGVHCGMQERRVAFSTPWWLVPER